MKKDDCELWQEARIDWLSALMAFNFPDWLSTLSVWWMSEGINLHSQPGETHISTHWKHTTHTYTMKTYADAHCIKKFGCHMRTADRKVLESITVASTDSTYKKILLYTVTRPVINKNTCETLPLWFIDCNYSRININIYEHMNL